MPTNNDDNQSRERAANSDEQAANVRGSIAANGCEPFAAQWLTVAEVADRLKVTPRTIQKRCKAGKLDARSVETPTGDQWQIDAAAVETQGTKAANEATNRAANSREQAANVRSEQRRTAANRSQPHLDAAPDFRARYIAQIEEQNSFLKSQLEDANRNAAELRSALRKALEIAPRQLTAGTPPDTQQRAETGAATDAATPTNPTKAAPQIASANNVPSDAADAVKSPAKRDGATDWNTIYGQIADELEAQEKPR